MRRPDPSDQILEQVASGLPVSQRSLARETGVALGLAHLHVHRMVHRGWLRIVRDGGNRVTYRITRAGLAERARRSRAQLVGSLQSYVQVRERIAERLAELSRDERFALGPEKRIVFYGADEVAEIGYICVQRSDLQLVGIVDDCAGLPFFGLRVSGVERLAPGRLGDIPFDVLVVMSFGDRKPVRRQLAAIGYPESSVFWI